MGLSNAFYLDESVVPLHYQNLYGLALNGSSRVLIRYYSTTVIQNMVVFIIPEQNCQQHALFVMSKNIFKIKIITKKYDYNLQTCAFSPSFVYDTYRNIVFGFEKKLNANAQIFYGFTPESITPKPSLLKESNYTNNFYDAIIKELDNYNKMKTEYRNKENKPQSDNKINTLKFNSFSSNNKVNTEILDKGLRKDYEEEKYFKKLHQNYHTLSKFMNNHNDKPNTYSIQQSPGFLASLKISSETRQLNIVNTTFYVAYHIDEPNVNAHIIFNQEYRNTKSNKRVDSSMRDKHSDFLLYYDKYNSNFIYDNDWVDKIDVSYNIDLWKMMKWLWVVLIFIFVVITFLIIGCLCGYVRSDRFCCFTRKNSGNEFTDESEMNLNSYRTRRGNGHSFNNESHINDDQLETICYVPNLDDDVTYATADTKKSKYNNILNNDRKKKRNHESDSYSYEYEYEFSNNSCGEDEGENYHRKKRKIKKKLKNSKKSSSLAASPYEFEVENPTDIDHAFSKNTENHINRNDENNNMFSIEENQEMPNPYGLPHLSPNLNDNEDDDNPQYPLC